MMQIIAKLFAKYNLEEVEVFNLNKVVKVTSVHYYILRLNVESLFWINDISRSN